MYLAKGLTDPRRLASKASRDGFGEGLVSAAAKDKRIVAVCADLTESTRLTGFKRRFPERFVQAGVHEQLITALGAGLALAGKVPFIASFAVFCPGRSWEQVRTNICLNQANVKIAGAHAGITVGPDGATHQATEDIAIMRCLPNMTVVVPCDAEQTRLAVPAVARLKGPVYLRFGRPKRPVFTTSRTPFRIGRAQPFRRGDDVAIMACGMMVHQALLAAEELKKEGIDCTVLNIHTVKPLDEKAVIAAAKRCGAVVTAEEHQLMGGLGSVVAEALSRHYPVPIESVGIDDRFGESGRSDELIERFGLGVRHVNQAVRRALKRKA